MAIAVDQATIGSSTTGDGTNAPSFVTTQTVAANGFIVVYIGWFTQGVLNSVSGGGLTWTVDKTGFPGVPANVVTGIASAQAPAGLPSGTTITFNTSVITSGPTQGGMSFTGVKTSSPVDGTPLGPTGVSPAAAGWSSGNYAIQGGSVIVACCWAETANATNTMTAPSVETLDLNAGGWGFCAGYRIESSAGSYPVAGTWSTNEQSNNVAVAYLAAPPGVQQVPVARHALGGGRW